MEDSIAKADYGAKIGNKLVCAYIVALTDFLKAPTIDRADISQYPGRVGDLISILASDDFKVESVTVQLAAPDGSLIEAGPAVENANGEWVYTATAANAQVAGSKVTIQAKDRPGNITVEEIVL